jgi:hypothetical protein
VTLVVAVTGPESIWLLADRRLSYAARPPKDDGRKIMFLETTDGVAILGYAGLGATRFRYTRHAKPPTGAPPRLGLGGSSALRLIQDGKWMRNLLRVVRANERGNASARAVADHLATRNSGVAATDQLVGPRCIVAWRYRKGGVKNGGGGQAYYTGLKQDGSSPSLPTIANGMDVRALVEAMMPRFMRDMETMLAGKPAPEWDRDEVNAELARLPHGPDETLR